jgi:mannose-6-phosphate isomerase-like protein (cupin superfamily)
LEVEDEQRDRQGPAVPSELPLSRDGDVLRVEIWAEPGGGVLAEHVHPRHEERYEVLEGEVTFHVDRKPLRPRAGEPVVVPAGVRHRFENTGEQVAHLLVEAEPALALCESIQDGAALAQIGKFTAGGKPRSLRALVEVAALAARYRETVVLISPRLPCSACCSPCSPGSRHTSPSTRRYELASAFHERRVTVTAGRDVT